MYLNCHSVHSLRYGTITIENLIQEAIINGCDTIALTDINSMTGVFDFYQECRDFGIKPVIGIEYRQGDRHLYTGIARNNQGFLELNMLLSQANIHKQKLPLIPPSSDNLYFIFPTSNIPVQLEANHYIGIAKNQLNKLKFSKLNNMRERLVVFHPVTHRSQREFELHNLLRCVDHNTILSKLNVDQRAKRWEVMLPLTDLTKVYADFPEILYNTDLILEESIFDFDIKKPKNKVTYTGDKASDKLLLEQLTFGGLEWRYGKTHKEATERAIRELEIIDKLNFGAYFLITWDIIRYSNHKGFFHIGRGSGANSLVSYCLGITDICPLELNLYFERFLNPARLSPPDFDIDWAWNERDEILSYIFQRFDSNKTAFCGAISTFKHRSIMREFGKVFGLAKNEIDVLSGTSVESHDPNSVVKKIHDYGLMVQGWPNMRTMHSCGILISEEPINSFTALDMPPKGFPTAQIDMYIAEEIGIEKLDILSQRGIGHINECVQIVKQQHNKHLDIRNTSKLKTDPKLNAKLAEGKTLGCFYIESPAMRGLLRRLKCDNYNVLVAASSIIRPGVAKSGMMREYIARHNNPQKTKYLHSAFEEHLGETYGIMVYQEDVLKIGHHFAGLDLADADIMRRAMTGKTRHKREFEKVKLRYFENCKQRGYSKELTELVYKQIESFAGYSFCKAHSASYAVESYMSLYLKTYYPMEFMVAVINNEGGFYRKEVYVHEAKMAGANIEAPCVNYGAYWASIDQNTIYIGFRTLKSLEETIGRRIFEERLRNGTYESLEDFVSRVPIGIEQLQSLIYVGAFRSLALQKGELTVKARMLLNKKPKQPDQTSLFKRKVKDFNLPMLEHNEIEDAFDELELLGFMSKKSPFELLQQDSVETISVSDLLKFENKAVVILGYLISLKPVPTAKGQMMFGTWVDEQGQYFDSAHFPDQVKWNPLQGAGCYLIEGKVVVDFHFPSIEVKKQKKLPLIPDPRYPDQQAERMRKGLPMTHNTSPAPLGRKPYPSKNEVDELFGRKKV